MTAPRVLVLGVGNVLRADDGVGPRVVDALAGAIARGTVGVPPGTVLCDGGARGIGLLPEVAGADRVVIVDAVAPGAGPGTVTVVPATEPGDPGLRGSEAVADLVATAALVTGRPIDLTLVGIEAACLDVGEDLSPAVAAAVPRAAKAVLAVVGGWGGVAR